MSLEWARARLLQHTEALRKLCEVQAAGRQKRPPAPVVGLRPGRSERPARHDTEKGTLLLFERPQRRRRA